MITQMSSLFNYPENYNKSVLNEAFIFEMNDLIIQYQLDAWIHRHSHVYTPEFKIGKLEC